MRSVFRDNNIESQFRKYGYVSVPFLTENETESLKQELLQFTPSDNYQGNQPTPFGKQSFHVTFFDSNKEYRQNVFDFIKSKFSSISNQLLDNYKCAQANVFLKPPHSGFVYPHQNLTITDEQKFTSVSFWLPLQDTGFENGTICLVPGSQTSFVNYRNTHINWPYVNSFKEGAALGYFIPINVKAGELLILDDRLIHYTPINKSNNERWVMHALWAPAESPIWFCDPKKDEVNIYQVNDDFWQFHLPGEFPSDKPYKTIPNTETLFTDIELLEQLQLLNNKLQRK